MRKVIFFLFTVFAIFFLSMGGSSLSGKDYRLERINDDFNFNLYDNLEFLISKLNLKKNNGTYKNEGIEIKSNSDEIESIKINLTNYQTYRKIKVFDRLDLLKKKYKNDLNCKTNYCFIKNNDGIILKFNLLNDKITDIILYRRLD